MSEILKQRNKKPTARALKSALTPKEVSHRSEDFARLIFSNGLVATSECIRCPEPPCINFTEAELMVPGFEQFPSDMSKNVCPTDAIRWTELEDIPAVNPERCISCGLCARRCPVGAIRLDPFRGAFVNPPTGDSCFVLAANMDQAGATGAAFVACQQTGQILAENDSVMLHISDLIEKSIAFAGPQFPNHFVRNLLIETGHKAAMRRRGDVNLRMDLVLEEGVAEVEFSTDAILDSPRNALDNIAVIISRYGRFQEGILPLIIGRSLPNKRTEYFAVINDVQATLGLSIRSVTVGAMLLLLWNLKKLDFSKGNGLYTAPGVYSIRNDIEIMIGRKINISQGHRSILESPK